MYSYHLLLFTCRYQLIRVHASSLGENCKWLEMFEDVDLILYCVALTDYDQFSDDANGVVTNKMLESKKLFESIVTHATFYQKDFLLILNKFDLLEEKIEQVPLTRCDWFHDFNPVISVNHNSSNPSLAQQAFHYIAVKFKRLFHSLTGRKLYVSLVTGLEPDSVDESFKYAREILKPNEEKSGDIMNEWSSCSIEECSSS
uniref:Putative extra-large guanine nucleotide-binding protein 2-like n=1 Tax=Davidia involucrata TaxID=16924 RepID=A0A5B6Z7Z4_DAVIN